MKSRKEIKAIAKSAMKEQWGTSIVTILVFIAIVIAGALISIPFSLRAPLLGMLVLYATLFFIDLPLAVNTYGVFIKIFNRERASAGELFSNFPINYLRKVGGMAWMFLFTLLWSLLLLIPGIIKGLAYSMTPYILADCPNVNAKEALKLSMRMTHGHKLDLFILGLSFIGWFLLSMLTFGILSIVFVNPYMYTTYSGFYVELRDKALANGVISHAELGVCLQ